MTDADTVRQTRTASHGWYIQRLARQLDLWMAEELAAFDLTHGQFAILMMVIECDGQTQAGIGQRFAMPPYAISRAIDGLETRGLVTRAPHPGSRRAHLVRATDAGRALAPDLAAVVARVNARLTAGLSPERATDFLDMLQTTLSRATQDGCS